MADRLPRSKNVPTVRVVSHGPWRQAMVLLAVAILTAGGTLGGFWLGRSTADLDRVYLDSVERLDRTNREAIVRLQAQLVDADLAKAVDREAAQAVKEDVRALKDQVASLTEEVTFYKSLMAPSSLARGVQIADFELSALDEPGRYRFHLLLTQTESRRDWVQGDVSLEIHGRRAGQESAEGTAGSDSPTGKPGQVLPLTEIAEEGTYPLKFRFRYFQDLTGVIQIPAGFRPERVVIKAGRRGASAEAADRTFDWIVAG